MLARPAPPAAVFLSAGVVSRPGSR